MTTHPLPRRAPARVLGVGAWLKNTACLLDGDTVHWSALHGDLGTPEACRALEDSVEALLVRAGGRVDAIAHDLHPDFESTRLALAWADRLQVPAIGVQHHHAHVALVQAEQGSTAPVIGLALDGVGLGTDGTAWGGELLRVAGADWQRLGHLGALALPGGDVAAREPWRMAAAALHALGRGDEIAARFTPVVGARLAAGVQTMLARGLNCPTTTSAGRWFDAAAGLLGLSVRQAVEAEAAIALEKAASAWLARADAAGAPAGAPSGKDAADEAAARAAEAPGSRVEGADRLDLRPLVAELVALAERGAVEEGAARFHLVLAQALAEAAIVAARREGIGTVVLSGGCFYNRVLAERLSQALRAAGLVVVRPGPVGPGDAGLALGQAWVAAHQLASQRCGSDPRAAAEAAAGTSQELSCA